MKKIIFLSLIAVLFIACQPKGPERYTQNSSEIDTFKSVIKSYNDQDWESMISHYADTAKTFNNSSDIGLSLNEMVDYHKQSLPNLASRGFLDKDQEYEMVLTDKGDTWVNFWGDWEGTLKANGKKIKIPVHLTAQFENGKVVRTSGNWDNAPMVLALQEIEAKNALSTDEKAIQTSIDRITKAWNSNDKDMMASAMTDNFVRTENGTTIAKNPKDYASFMDIYHGAFPDFQVAIDKTVIDGNTAYLNWTCTGTNSGNFLENDPTRKKIKTHGFSTWVFDKNGKAIQEDAFYDNLVVFNQLGIVPPKQ